MNSIDKIKDDLAADFSWLSTYYNKNQIHMRNDEVIAWCEFLDFYSMTMQKFVKVLKETEKTKAA